MCVFCCVHMENEGVYMHTLGECCLMWGDLNLKKNGCLCHHTHQARDISCCFMNYLVLCSFFFGIFLRNPHLCDAGVLLKPQFLCGFNNKVIYITLKAREVIHVDYLTDLPKNGFSAWNFTEILWVDLFHGNGREKFPLLIAKSYLKISFCNRIFFLYFCFQVSTKG